MPSAFDVLAKDHEEVKQMLTELERIDLFAPAVTGHPHAQALSARDSAVTRPGGYVPN